MKNLIFAFTFFAIATTAVAQQKQPSISITHLTGNFYTYVSYGKYNGELIPANAMYLVTKQGVVLFDTPWDDSYYQPLLDSIWKRYHQKVIMCIATHFHKDRTGGLKYYNAKGIKTYTTKLTDSLCIVHHANRAKYLIQNDTTFNVGGYSFKTYYAGPGHTLDNIVIYVPQYRILYGGCLIKSTQATDLGNLEDADVKEWANSIHNIQRKFPNPDFIIVGHDDYTDKNSLDHTLQLISTFNKQHT